MKTARRKTTPDRPLALGEYARHFGLKHSFFLDTDSLRYHWDSILEKNMAVYALGELAPVLPESGNWVAPDAGYG